MTATYDLDATIREARRLSDVLSFLAIDTAVKRPAYPWKHRQQERATPRLVERWLRGGFALGIVCGAISGNLEDLDVDEVELVELLLALIQQYLPDLYPRLTLIRTPSGGLHIPYRCAEIEGNTRLAQKPNPDDPRKPKTMIETRGEGGQFRSPLGPPRPDGRRYQVVQGSLATIPTITPDERATIHALARSFNRWVRAVEAPRPRSDTASMSGNRPGDDFCVRATWGEILEPHGWHFEGYRGDGVGLWTRPGKDPREGISATTGYGGSDLLYAFSSNAYPFEDGRGYNKFSAYTLLNFDGDFSAAAAELARQGYGRQEREVSLDSMVSFCGAGEGEKVGGLPPLCRPEGVPLPPLVRPSGKPLAVLLEREVSA